MRVMRNFLREARLDLKGNYLNAICASMIYYVVVYAIAQIVMAVPLIADYKPLCSAAKEAGAHAFFLSGSGPTCMAIYTDSAFFEKMQNAVQTLSSKWNVLSLAIDREGVTQIG